jgi:hypothetical protein
MNLKLLCGLLLLAGSHVLHAGYAISTDTNGVSTITYTNNFDYGVCAIQGREGRRWVVLENLWATQRIDQVTRTLPPGYSDYRLKCWSVAPGNAYTRLPLAYGNISTVAGLGEVPAGVNGWLPEYEGAQATDVNLSNPTFAMADAAGNIYVVEKDGHAVVRIDTNGIITTVAGTHQSGFDGDFVLQPANTVRLNSPSALQIAGNRLYIFDGGNRKIRYVQDGVLFTLFTDPSPMANWGGMAVDLDEDEDGLPDNIFYACGNELRRWESDGVLSVLRSDFINLANMTLNARGRPVVADPPVHRLYEVRTRPGGEREVIAGDGFVNRGQRGGEADEVSLPGASSVWFLPIGGYLVGLDQGARVWYVDEDDNAFPIVMGKPGAHAGDGRWFRARGPKISHVKSVTVAPSGDIILVEGNGFVRRIEFKRRRP